MDRWTGSRAAAWPWFVALLIVVFAVGCQDGSGPNLVTSPEGEPTFDGAKPPPPPPPPAADPAIAFFRQERVRSNQGWVDAWFLKVMNADGSNLTSIFTQPGVSLCCGDRPAWSPDGHCIAFYTTGVGNPDPGIWLVDVNVVNGVPTGTNARRFLPRPAWMPAWSPLGDQIAYTTNSAPYVLCVIPVSGGPAQVLYSSPNGELITSPSWSPDASKIAFEQEGGIGVRVLDLTDMTVTTVVGPEWGPAYPSWARTQDALVFTGTDPASGEAGLYTMQLPSGTPTLVCAGTQPDWSPNDQALVFKGALSRVELATGIITDLMAPYRSAPIGPSWRRF